MPPPSPPDGCCCRRRRRMGAAAGCTESSEAGFMAKNTRRVENKCLPYQVEHEQAKTEHDNHNHASREYLHYCSDAQIFPLRRILKAHIPCAILQINWIYFEFLRNNCRLVKLFLCASEKRATLYIYVL